MRLLLIRHGQTPHNVAGALDTAFPGAGLTPLGRAQAAAIPAALADERIVGIYASRLVRTQLTAEPLANERGLAVEVRDGLEEVSAGDLELRSDDASVQTYAAAVRGWLQGDLERSVPGGPSGHEFLARYDAAVRAILAGRGADETVAVFSHGAAIRAYAAVAARVPGDEAAELRIKNTAMGVLEGSPDTGWELVRWSGDPLGGPGLADGAAHDVTGESTDEATRRA